MLTITQSDNALIVQGQANGLYPDNGTNSYPLNSISLVVDESDIATFRSAATNDVLFSGRIEEITIGGEAVTKDSIFAKFDAVANSSGGGGDVDLSDYYTKQEADEEFATKTELSAVDEKADDAVFQAGQAKTTAGQASVKATVAEGKADEAYTTANTAKTTAETAQTTANTAQTTANEAKSTAESKQDALVSGTNIKTVNGESLLGEGNIQIEEPDLTDYYTKDEADGKYATKTDLSSTADSLQTAVGVAQGTAEDAQDEAMAAKTLAQSKQDKLVSGENIKTINGESLLGEGNIVIQGGGGDVDLSDYYTKEEADAKYATTEEMNDAAADISALEADMTQKQAKLVSGTNIKTVNGSTLLGSGNVTIPVMTDDERQKLYDAADGKTYRVLFFGTPLNPIKAGAYYFEPYKRSDEPADIIQLNAWGELSEFQQYLMKVSRGVPWNGNGFEEWYPVQMGYFYGGEVEFGGLKMTTTFGESGMGMGSTQKKSNITLSVVDSNGAAAQAYSDCHIFVNKTQVKGIYEISSVTFQSGDIVTFLNENSDPGGTSISASMTQDNLNSGLFNNTSCYCFKNLSANPEPFYGYDMEWNKVVFSGGGGGDVDLSNYYTKTQVDTKLTNKQDKLVSGTNIKTVNYNSIVGSGNLSISTGMLKDDADKAYLPMGFPPSDVRSCRYTIDTDTVPTIYGAEHEYDFEGLFYAPLKGTQTTYISSDNDPDFQNKVFRISKQSINNIDWTLAYPFMLGAPDSSSSTYGADNSYGVSFLWDRATGMWKFFLNNTNGTMANRLKYATVFINGVPIRGQYSFIDLNDTNKLYPVYIRPGDVVAIFNESSSVTNGQAVFSYGVSDSSKYAVIYQVAGNNPNPLFSRQNGVKKYLADEWYGTADEYAALETKDENTTYFVTE